VIGALLACLALGIGCGPVRLPGRVCAPLNGVCRDGLPVRLLVNPSCPDGLCGFSCLPGRWTIKEP